MCRTGYRSHATKLNAMMATREDPDQDSSSSSISDNESCVSSSSSSSAGNNNYDAHPEDLFFGDGLMRVEEDERVYSLIKHTFLSGLGENPPPETEVVAIHKKNWSSSDLARARIQSFLVHHRLLGNHNGSEGRLKFCWFGTSKDGVDRIMSHGFGFPELEQNDGRGIHLSPDDSPKQSVESSPIDEDGLRHVLLCRVLLGKSELVHPGSAQTHPSSEEFSSGVDSLTSPKRYILWGTNMNTHILPEYVITFKTPRRIRNPAEEDPMMMMMAKKQSSSSFTRVPFPALIRELSRFLPPVSVNLMTKSHKNYTERRIARSQLIHVIRQLAGDRLLLAVIKSWRRDLTPPAVKRAEQSK